LYLRQSIAYLVSFALFAQPVAAQNAVAKAPVTKGVPAAAAPAQTGAALRFDGREYETHARILLRWPSAQAARSRTSVNGSMGVITLPSAVNANVNELKNLAPNFIAAAALSADRRTVRLALSKNVRIVKSYDGNEESIDFVEGGAPDPAPYNAQIGLAEPASDESPQARSDHYESAELKPLINWPAPAGAPRVKVEASQSGSFSRITISGANFGPHLFARKGDRAAVTIPGLYALDIASLRSHLPNHVKDAVRYNSATHTSLVLDVEAGYQIRQRQEANTIYVDIMPPGTVEGSFNPDEQEDTTPKTKTKTAEPKSTPKSIQSHEESAPNIGDISPQSVAAPRRVIADPAPSGAVAVRIKETKPSLVLDFGFEAPAPAAIFRRGGNIFVVFATKANFTVPNIPAGSMIEKIEPIKGEGVAGVKISASDNAQINPSALGNHWFIGISANAPIIARSIAISGERAPDDSNRIKAVVSDAIANGSFIDPEVGDSILVGMALGPPSEVAKTRSFLEATIINSWHGLAVIPRADNLEIRLAPDGFVVVGPNGLELANVSGGQGSGGFANNAPGFVDFENWRMGPEANFLLNLDKLKKTASIEANEMAKGFQAQTELARFYLAWDMPHEALGVVRSIKATNPEATHTAEVIGLQGVAQTAMLRGREALETLSSAEVADDPASQLWASVAALQSGDPTEARKRFAIGVSALAGFSKEQQAKFLLNEAISAFQLEDLVAAQLNAERAKALATDERTKEFSSLIGAQVDGKNGNVAAATSVLDELAKSHSDEIRARAVFAKSMLDVASDGTKRAASIAKLDGLRYDWRGDDLELDILRNLAELYIEGGDIRSGLSTLSAAATLRPELPAARELRAVLAQQFRHLFLEGGAEGMDPIQALALFYDYRNLTPIGPEGDQMARGLADRLISLDLLPQATELLKHQVDNRLQGFAKSQVATDLAAVYILDHKPEEALQTIWNSRITQLPAELNHQRRIIEAISLAELGRLDHAMDMLEFDNSKDASKVRTEIYWRKGDYANAAIQAKINLPAPAPSFEPSDAGEVLRASLAMSLSGDRAGAVAMARPYGAAMGKTAYAEAFKIVTSNEVPAAQRLTAAVAAVRGSSPFDKLIKDLRTNIATVSSPSQLTVQAGQTGPTDGNPGAGSRASNVNVIANNGRPTANAANSRNANLRATAAPKNKAKQRSSDKRIAQNSNNRVQAPKDPPVIGGR